MRVNVLGPIEITADNRIIRPTGQAQRALLAALVLDHGKVVPVGRLTALLWGDHQPATARTKIQCHVSALRQVIGSGPRDAAGPLLTIPPGYLLTERAVVTDLAEFGSLVARGTQAAETGQPASAASLYGQALALWRGTAFADVSAPQIRAAAGVLAEQRLLAAEAKAEADLALGRCGTVVAEMSAWLISHPLRERVRGLLMMALHNLGCRADALTVYRAGHQMIAEELGFEPSAWLRGVYQRILTDDAA
jgi:DNA-binding SARP family transcriptional activator